MKKNLLSIASVMFLGLTANAQTIVYSNDFSTAPVPVGSGAFTHASDGSNWTITAPTGHGEWDQFDIIFDTPLNFATSGNKPILSVKGSTSQTVAFEIFLVDDQGHIADNPLTLTAQPNVFAIIKDQSPVVFTYDFTGQFTDNYGNNGAPQGAVDSTKIASIRFKINPGWASSAYTYHAGLSDAADYKMALTGSGMIKIDKLQIGAALPSGIATVNANTSFAMYPNPTNGLVTLNLNANAISVSVSNILGQEVYSSKTNGSNLTIDLAGKEKGLYYISIKSDEGVTTKRLFLN